MFLFLFLLHAPDVCEIILQQSQEIISLEVLASITDPVVLRLHECKRAERLNVSQRDEDIDSEDENLYDEPYADIVGNDSSINLLPANILSFTSAVLIQPSWLLIFKPSCDKNYASSKC